ncbi:S8 family peptidase [Brevibacterium sp. PAMC21349]|nr:S8 family peptidase [Brevibacterium sp. PAMC21349]
MKKIISCIAVFILIFSFFSQPRVSKAKNQSEKNYLVEFNKKLDTKLIEKEGGEIKGKYKHFKTAKASLTADELYKIKKNPTVKLIEEDVTVQSTPLNGETYLENEYSWGTKRINANKAHENGITGKGIKLAILDTGISNQSGIVVEKQASFIDSEEDVIDLNGHGTAVSSIIATSYENSGFHGVAPDVKLYVGKVLDQNGTGQYSDIIEGIEWAIEEDINIINMSFGGSKESEILKNVIDKAYDQGVLMISSVGNEGTEKVTYPAAYNNVIGVVASDFYNQMSSLSNYSDQLELVAPGVNIQTLDLNGDHITASGTSIAASYVSGAAALLWSQNVNLDNKEMRTKLKDYATTLENQKKYDLVNVDPSFSQYVPDNIQTDSKQDELTEEELAFLTEAGWSEEAIDGTTNEEMKEFISEGAMNPDYSETTYTFVPEDEISGDVQAQNLKNGGSITLKVSASYLGIKNSNEKQFKINGSYNWNSMPKNRYVDLFALAWTDNAWYKSTSKLSHTYYGAIPITESVTVFKPSLKAGMSWKVDLRVGSHDDIGKFTQYIYLPKSASSKNNGPLQAIVEYSHAFTTITPSIGGGSGGFSYGISTGKGKDYADNPPISSVKSY